MMSRPPSAFARRTASRLSSGIMQPPKTGAPLMGITNVSVIDRPITQQGVTGLRPSTTKGPQFRQVLDKRYYDGLIRMKMKTIADEVVKLNTEIEIQQQQHATSEIYEKRVREIAAELTELQGQLADYNMVVDKINTNTGKFEIDREAETMKFENENLAAELDQLFGQNRTKEEQLQLLEQEIQNEKNVTENLIEEMNPDERQSYEELKVVADELKKAIDQSTHVLEELSQKKTQYEDKLMGSQIRQEAVRLYYKLHEREERKAALIAEEKNRATPAQEKETLMQKMKEDNAEMAAMERQLIQINEQIKKKKEELELIEQDLEESQNERHQKFKELKRREETMEQFMSTYEDSKNAEMKRIEELEGKIVIALEQMSKNIAGGGSLPSRDEFSALIENLSMKQEELQKSKLTVEELARKQQELTKNVEKVENLEIKIQNEIASITEKLTTMTEEIKVFVDLDKLRGEAQEKRNKLLREREDLLEAKPSLISTKEELQRENEELLKDLNENETYVQLNNLEKKLQLLEQGNLSMREFIQSKRTEMDYEPIRENALKLVNDYNQLLREYYTTKGSQ
ncbi:UNVERIFIED_CONTAM: hypothetical protein PYX00_000548 [Menopon gallinae]